MAFAPSSYSISRSPGTCAATGRELRAGETVVATLCERAGSGVFERLDYATEAWDHGARPGAPFVLFGLWRTQYQPGETKKPQLLSDPELLELFEELGAATEPRQLGFRYLLALLLVRRRALRCLSAKASSMMVLPKGASLEQPPIEVIDPGLDEQMIAEAMEQLGQIVPVDPDASEQSPKGTA
ncbi:MAG: hypothetical protein ACOYN0_12540 [Phycisphaerales bacterium]